MAQQLSTSFTRTSNMYEETLTLDLALLDTKELDAIATAIVRQHIFPPCREGWNEATHLIMPIFDEIEARQIERHSTHGRIDARYVSDRSLLDIYYARRQEEEAALPQCMSEDIVEQKAYRDRYNQRADASKQWPIYRILRARGVHIDLYFPGTEQEMIDIFKSYPKKYRNE